MFVDQQPANPILPGQPMMHTRTSQPAAIPIRTHQNSTRRQVTHYSLAIVLALLLAFTSYANAHARHAPNRHDRRPDRETRIHYPRTAQTSASRRATPIHSAPPANTPGAALADAEEDAAPTDAPDDE